MKLQDVLELLPGDSVVITKKTRQAGGQYAMSLIAALNNDQPYFIDKIDKITRRDDKLRKTIVDRANIYLKGYAGLRIDPASFEVVEED